MVILLRSLQNKLTILWLKTGTIGHGDKYNPFHKLTLSINDTVAVIKQHQAGADNDVKNIKGSEEIFEEEVCCCETLNI